ncbi:MAG: hypothetical protein DA408_02930 [Bacteroidetes bacterium]|nr:MAG: hypothetical protein C7N36_21300 [Bacteroidota bacterium]PTM14554.1 MAG: hypothetical protein DA408_02930 [Bacteroidota bacterium]
MKLTALLSACLLALTLWSCGPNYVYEQELALPDTGWTYPDSLVATFNITDTTTIYNLHLRLAHQTDFPYANFYVRIHTRFPDGQRLTEQLSLELAGKGGVWLGDCSAEQCTLDIPIQEGAFFNQTGTYQVVIEQFSRSNPLPGIGKVTFSLEKTRSKRG